ncbi:uncharacterized protein CTRU02_214363 [Colletotrichum truncatum]|uniref:Uncharacterized protein n=1 Tax=Colletotrichum truncatum TaxID=5467 RepID=A0ACC3YEI4_COLTU
MAWGFAIYYYSPFTAVLYSNMTPVPDGHWPIKMSCQFSTPPDVVSDWVSSMSPHTESPRCFAIPSEAKQATCDRSMTGIAMSGLARTPLPALSEGDTYRSRSHNTNTNQHCQSSTGACPIVRVAFYHKKYQPRCLARTARAEMKHDVSSYNFNGCAASTEDEMTEWEDSVEASEPLVNHLQFGRRVDLDGTAAGRSLITVMLEQSGLCTDGTNAAACAA